MEWIKRNLFFVIGAAVALALVVVASLFSWNQNTKNNEARDLLGQKYEELKRLNEAPVHPGDGKVDNIQRAKEQQARVNEFIQKTAAYFRPIPPIPDTGGKDVSDRQFASALSTTVEQMRRAADVAGVTVASNYNFTFEVQRTNLIFGKEHLRPLAAQLGEIKAICDVVFGARVNTLEGIRRERLAPEDSQGFTDYHDRTTVTNNEFAVLVPYDVTVQCFSAELGKLLSGFANAPYPMLVQRLNVERATTAAANPHGAYGDPQFGQGYPPPGMPGPWQGWPGRGGPGGTGRSRTRPAPVINEEPVKVTLWLEVVKPKPAAK